VQMFTYYLELAMRSLKRSPGLTVLMMLAIGFGVAASMTTWSVFRGVSGDPIPWKSSKLFVPQIDMWGPGQHGGNHEPPDALDYADAMALMRDHRAARQSAIYLISPSVIPAGADAVRSRPMAMGSTANSSRCWMCHFNMAAAGVRTTTHISQRLP
jgi:putative ABC transport system permease protein